MVMPVTPLMVIVLVRDISAESWIVVFVVSAAIKPPVLDTETTHVWAEAVLPAEQLPVQIEASISEK